MDLQAEVRHDGLVTVLNAVGRPLFDIVFRQDVIPELREAILRELFETRPPTDDLA